jgi:hypothetical protein
MISSPPMTLPCASTARHRSASPSWAMPRSAPCSTTAAGAEVRRADAVVDVDPVRIVADHGVAGPRVREHLGRHSRGRTVRAVDHDVQTVETRRKGGEEVQDVPVLGIREPADAADVTADRGELGLLESGLDAVLDLVGQLDAAAREDLDAVVRGRVVRRRDHDAEVGADVGDQERCSGRRDDACVEHVDAGARKPRCDGRREELAGDARVTGDHGHEPAALSSPGLGRAPLAQDDRSRLGKGERQFDRDLAIRETPDTIGSEESWHVRESRISAWRTEAPCEPS